MKAFVVCFFALVAAASCTPVNNKNLITDILKNLAEKNREKLAVIEVPELTTDHGTVTNLVVNGADKFVIERLDAEGPLSIDIKNATLSIPQLDGSALWAISGLNVPELGLNVDGSGDANAVIKNLWATVKLDLSLDGTTPVLEDFSDLQITLGSIESTVNGLQDPAAQDIINNQLAGYLNANFPRIAEENKANIIAKINEIISGNA